MLRLFTDPQQAQTLEKRIADPAYAGFFGDSIQAAASRLPFRHDAGGIYQHKTGFLDIPLLLTSLKQYFFQRGLLGEKQLAYQEIEPSPPGVDYNGIQAARCIFCEGYQAQNNPWFEWLPFQPAKGEILTIESRQIPATHIVNRGNWLIPVSDNRFRTGATNQWQFTDDLPSQSGRDTVEAGLRVLFTETPGYQVIDHKAGIRPATRDKKPFIGLHPQFRQLGIFNGFGARGSLMIPYYARLFSRSLAANDRLPETVDIQRYYPQ
jgi:glycine/D-amino acid oxidase-like deaminating enzyme